MTESLLTELQERDKIRDQNDNNNEMAFNLNSVLSADFINLLENSSFEQQLSQFVSLLSTSRSKLFKEDSGLFYQYSYDTLMEISTSILSCVEVAIFIFKYFDSDDIEWTYQIKDLFSEIEQEILNASPVFEKFIEGSSNPIFQDLSDSDISKLNIKCKQISQGQTFIKKLLGFIRYQIEVSKDWVDCIEILNQINQELKKCEILVFEIKERSDQIPSISQRFIEISSLESFVKDVFDGEKIGTLEQINSTDILNKWNRNCQNFIFQVNEKIKPLETSLIFFKLRIEYFKEKALELFPAAVHNIEQRRHDLEIKCKKLQNDFSSVKKKFQEDKWMFVFSEVNKQAMHNMNSIELEIQKFNTSSPLTKKATESYKTYKVKKDSYIIIRIIALMEWGIWNNLTNNSKIIEGYNALYERWKNLNKDIIKIDNIFLKEDVFSEATENNSQLVLHDFESEASQSIKSCLTTPKASKTSIKYHSLIPVSKNKRRPSLYDTLKIKSEIQSTPGSSHHSNTWSKKSKTSLSIKETPSMYFSKLNMLSNVLEKTGIANKFSSDLILKSTFTENSPYSRLKTRASELNISQSHGPLRHMISTGQLSCQSPNLKFIKYKENISSLSSIPRLSRRLSCLPILENKSPIKMIPIQRTFLSQTSIPIIKKKECIYGAT